MCLSFQVELIKNILYNNSLENEEILMKTIPSEIVEKVCSELDRYSESRMREEAGRFLRQQPHLVQFLQEFTADFHPEIQQFSLYLSYLIWKICGRGWGNKVPKLTWELCYQSFLKERQIWKEGRPLSQRKNNQPYLLQCLKTFLEEDHNGIFKKDVERGSLFLILKSVISAFEKAAAAFKL
jgi:hypothetical protein